MDIVAGIIVVIAVLIGIVLTIATLPGTWLMLVVALLCQWWRGDTFGVQTAATDASAIAVEPSWMFSWWTIGIGLALAVLAEIIEFLASALGAAKAGGTKRGAIGATVGGLAGAILGTFIPVPILGTLAGAAVGAGVGALLAERHGGMSWEDSGRVATGAAIGRLVATVFKSACAVAMGVILVIDAFFQIL